MSIVTDSLLGEGLPGVFLSVVGNVLFHSPSLDGYAVQTLAEGLNLEPQSILIGGSPLLGSLVVGNSNGVAIADIASEDDIDVMTSYGDVIVMESAVNAAGNLLLVTEKGLVASPVISEEGMEVFSDVFKVPVGQTPIAGYDTIGSNAVANTKGLLLHPDVKMGEVEILESVLGVKGMVGTVNYGAPFVGAGLIASDDGAFAGSETTGPELNRIEDALGLID